MSAHAMSAHATIALALASAVIAMAASSAPVQAQSAGIAPTLVGSKYGERRAYFRDWLAACRPGGYCSALTYDGAEGDFFDYSVRVGSAEPGLDYEVVFTAVERFADPATAFDVAIDGAPLASLAAGDDAGWGQEPGDALNEHRFTQARSNLEILPAMRDGVRMAVTFRPDGAPDAERETIAFSLMGLQAALAWIERNRME